MIIGWIQRRRNGLQLFSTTVVLLLFLLLSVSGGDIGDPWRSIVLVTLFVCIGFGLLVSLSEFADAISKRTADPQQSEDKADVSNIDWDATAKSMGIFALLCGVVLLFVTPLAALVSLAGVAILVGRQLRRRGRRS